MCLVRQRHGVLGGKLVPAAMHGGDPLVGTSNRCLPRDRESLFIMASVPLSRTIVGSLICLSNITLSSIFFHISEVVTSAGLPGYQLSSVDSTRFKLLLSQFHLAILRCNITISHKHLFLNCV
jgi:hypothetical protein